ncbi:hypothetical protein [Rhodococcus sp. Eu-32]|uniref:hypothetical protein n=1 Tax=Rhodococcus sp. Eu-32 TaxID=1017319 RepID=UPI0014022752|nr:hypothetical protein [Rhodococcus sp. Eu-32]
MIATIPSLPGAPSVVELSRMTGPRESMFGGEFECSLSTGETVFVFADEIEVQP